MKKVVKITKYILVVSTSILIYFLHEAIYPGVSFYEEEFLKVTGKVIPKSAKFIEKSASYPDFHGDYCSSSQILLSKKDYQELLSELKLNDEMENTAEIMGFKEFESTIVGKDERRIVKMFTRKGEGITERYQFIGFYDDLQTIFVNVCKT